MKIMGIVNVTTDSFSDGGKYATTDLAVSHAMQLIADGADIVDVGGESTRPGALPLPVAEEVQRIVPVIARIREFNPHIPISIDTYKAEVAAEAVAAGATMVNDVTAGQGDTAMFSLIRKLSVPYIMMHMQGVPRTMQQNPFYINVVSEVSNFLVSRIRELGDTGSPVYVDPGIGFGKTTAHNLELLRNLHRLSDVAPIVLGISRKSFIGEITGIEHGADRDPATAVLHALLIDAPVTIARVHNVQNLRALLQIRSALRGVNS